MVYVWGGQRTGIQNVCYWLKILIISCPFPHGSTSEGGIHLIFLLLLHKEQRKDHKDMIIILWVRVRPHLRSFTYTGPPLQADVSLLHPGLCNFVTQVGCFITCCWATQSLSLDIKNCKLSDWVSGVLASGLWPVLFMASERIMFICYVYVACSFFRGPTFASIKSQN